LSGEAYLIQGDAGARAWCISRAVDHSGAKGSPGDRAPRTLRGSRQPAAGKHAHQERREYFARAAKGIFERKTGGDQAGDGAFKVYARFLITLDRDSG
jgi:hypothetical protein